MWIRTQSRKGMIKVEYIEVEGNAIIGQGFGSVDFIIELGEYKTEAEALSVLDKIQKAIANMDDVFAMPEGGA